MNIQLQSTLLRYRAKASFAKIFGRANQRLRDADESFVHAVIGNRRYRVDAANESFWRKVTNCQWERHTFAALGHFLRDDSVYVDIGAWIGPTVLFAAPRCRVVYCVEPDPISYPLLLANLRENAIDNVHTFYGALAPTAGTVRVENERGFGNSMTRTAPVDDGDDNDDATVAALDFDGLLQRWDIDKIDLMKIDIEGAEFDLIPSLIDLLPRTKPPIHLSLHAPFFPEAERREKLAAVIELARHYAFCYGKKLNRIAPDDMATNARFSDKFESVVLTDAPL